MQNYKIGSGLSNLGNTCFFNATIQTLLYTPPLFTLLQSKSHSNSCTHKDSWCVFCQLERMHFATQNTKVYQPVAMVKNLKTIFKKFKLGRQEDSHQFLRYLIEGMQNNETGPLTKDMSRQDKQKLIRRTDTFNIFGGLMRTVVQCLNCKQKSLTEERFYDVNIECARSNSLVEGISKFFEVDELSGYNKYNCQHCKKLSNARKRFYMMQPPEIMTFQFKRFTNSLRKIGKHINFPHRISLSKYFESERKVTFDIYGLIVHAGGTSWSGHYYAYVKVGDNWYKMDDSHVARVSEEAVFAQNVYLLFYKKSMDQKPQQNHQIIQKVKNLTPQKVTPKQPLQNGIKKTENSDKDKDLQQTKESNVSSNEIVATVTGKSKKEKKAEKKKLKAQQKMTEKLVLMNHAQDKAEKQNGEKEAEEDDIDSIEVPGFLPRRRSKEQALRETPMLEIILKYAENLMQLQSKLRRTRHRSFSNLTTLRKCEVNMKKRKIS